MSVVGYVLAGGASSRFGSDKAQAKLGGKPMLTRMRELVLSVCGEVRIIVAAKAAGDGAGLIADRWPGAGPLGGIITALQVTADVGRSEWNLVVGCDMPFLTADWLRYLAERAAASSADVIAPRSANGLEPLCAVWRTDCVSKLQSAFDSGVRKVTEAMKHLQMEVIDQREWKRFDSAGHLFWNMNTMADYEEAKRMLESTST